MYTYTCMHILLVSCSALVPNLYRREDVSVDLLFDRSGIEDGKIKCHPAYLKMTRSMYT